MDVTILQNKISATVDYFNKRTTDLLFPSAPAQPAAPGAPIRWINLPGKIDNKGVEVSVSASIISQPDISWDFGVNATFLKNNVSELLTSTGAPVIIPTGTLSGQGSSGATVQQIKNDLPINAFVTREFLGFDKATGNAIYRDNGSVFYYLGNPNPDKLFGLSTTFRYKKLSVIVNMNGAAGHKIYNETLNNIINVGSIKRGRNIAVSVYENPVKESFANRVTNSSRFLEKGDYLKMTNATLSYNIGNVGTIFRGVNVYATGQNLFVITDFSGFDPEVNVDKNVNGVPSVGIEYAPYPSARTITFGVNFSL
jgi:iron complex outermembrane receptor protein